MSPEMIKVLEMIASIADLHCWSKLSCCDREVSRSTVAREKEQCLLQKTPSLARHMMRPMYCSGIKQ